jgi:hypothetical protein
MTYGTVARIARIVWLVAIVALVTPVAALWLLKLVAAVAGCHPGPAPCAALPLGRWFKATLDIAMDMSLGGSLPLALLMVAAGITAGHVWRAVAGIAAPLVVLLLTVIGALSTTFEGCNVSEAGASGCTLWGADVNHSFGLAGVAPWLLIIGLPIAAIAAAPAAIVASIVRRRFAAPVKAAA